MDNPNGKKPRQLLRNPDYAGAMLYAYDRLRDLPPNLTYHNLWHTEQVVVPAVQRFASSLKIDPDQIRLVEVAAAFHDIGFVETYQGHELAGISIASAVLPRFGLSPDEIEQIQGMILATRLPQNPQCLTEEILADADLDVLGRNDFFEQNDALYREVVSYGYPVNHLQWLEGQVKFLSGHEYFTSAARSIRGFGKQTNMSGLEDKFSQVLSTCGIQ